MPNQMTIEEFYAAVDQDFTAWRQAHEDDVGDLDGLEQIERYAADAAWHASH